MKIIINTDVKYTETEVIINCSRMNDDIEKIFSTVRMLDAKLADNTDGKQYIPETAGIVKLSGKKDGRQYILEASDIIYIECTDKRTFIYTLNDVYESSLKFYEMEEKLISPDFMKASRSCIFNINHIIAIEPDLERRLILIMPKEIKIVVSRQYSAEVKHKLEEFQ